MPRFDALLLRVLVTAEIALGCWIFHDAAYVTTYRLFINHRSDDASRSTAAQRFDIEERRVVPQIAVRDDERIAFRAALGKRSRLHVDLRPNGPAHYEIHWQNDVADRVIAAGEPMFPTSLAIPIPAEAGTLSLVSRGALTWVDPRLVRELHIAPKALALALLVAASIAIGRRRPVAAPQAARRVVWFRRVAVFAGALFTVAALEAGLRALGDHIPPGIAAERHDLGEVRKDPRWEDTRRYARRLRARVNETNEWRYGDIVRMGYIPPDVSDGVLHRFPFQTDEEGFRNVRTRERIEIAALGDSFTDAMTLDAHDSWTSVLERMTGFSVQNYGTAGFGPQQELRVLTDYVVHHHPKIVVLAYFAGNDLFDAEAFDDFDRSGGSVQRSVPGWQIKNVVSRADTWFLVSALRAAGGWASRRESAEARPIDAPTPHVPAEGPLPVFERGMFTAAVNGRTLRWAFMPPYLNTLTMSEKELASREGWSLTRHAIVDMQRVSRDAGAELIVMFLPFKSQIYLPILTASMPRAELSRALQFYLRDNFSKPDAAVMMRNRLAQNKLLQRFCSERGIRFLDTTEALAARVQAGENVYFPDESHFNETGHRIVAETLGGFLGY